MKVYALALTFLVLISCGKKSSSKHDTPGGQETQKTESPVVGSLKRSGAIKSSFGCTQNYIPGHEEGLESLKNEYFKDTESCVDDGYAIACVYNKMQEFPEKQRGLINWYSASSNCAKDYTQFNNEKAAMEFLNSQL